MTTSPPALSLPDHDGILPTDSAGVMECLIHLFKLRRVVVSNNKSEPPTTSQTHHPAKVVPREAQHQLIGRARTLFLCSIVVVGWCTINYLPKRLGRLSTRGNYLADWNFKRIRIGTLSVSGGMTIMLTHWHRFSGFIVCVAEDPWTRLFHYQKCWPDSRQYLHSNTTSLSVILHNRVHFLWSSERWVKPNGVYYLADIISQQGGTGSG